MNSFSGVLGNYVYNSLLTGRPYFFQLLDDAHVVIQFSKEKLGRAPAAIAAEGDNYALANYVSRVVPNLKFVSNPNGKLPTWADLVETKQELWPIQYLVPGGAYIH